MGISFCSQHQSRWWHNLYIRAVNVVSWVREPVINFFGLFTFDFVFLALNEEDSIYVQLPYMDIPPEAGMILVNGNSLSSRHS